MENMDDNASGLPETASENVHREPSDDMVYGYH